MTTLGLRDAVLVSEGDRSAPVLNYLMQFGPERVAGLIFTHPAPQSLQTHHPVLAQINTPTLIICNPQAMMMPLPTGPNVTGSLPHVKVTASQGHRGSERPEQQWFDRELSQFITNL